MLQTCWLHPAYVMIAPAVAVPPSTQAGGSTRLMRAKEDQEEGDSRASCSIALFWYIVLDPSFWLVSAEVHLHVPQFSCRLNIDVCANAFHLHRRVHYHHPNSCSRARASFRANSDRTDLSCRCSEVQSVDEVWSRHHRRCQLPHDGAVVFFIVRNFRHRAGRAFTLLVLL